MSGCIRSLLGHNQGVTHDPHPEAHPTTINPPPGPAHQPHQGDSIVAGDLLARMRAGDREAVGEFINRYGNRIRRRVRGKLNPAMRRVFDSQEILATVARRLDKLVYERRITADEDAQLWTLVANIARNATIDKVRLFQRLRRVENDDRAFAQSLLHDLETAGRSDSDGCEIHIERLLRAIPDSTDRQILELWLRGIPCVAIAQSLRIPPGTVRRRWGDIKRKLIPSLERDLTEGERQDHAIGQ